STDAGLWSYTTHSWPYRMHRRTRFAPMRPRPIIASCMSLPVGRTNRDVRPGECGGPDDAREVPELGDPQLAAGIDAVAEPVGMFHDAAADHDEIGPQHIVQVREIAIESSRPPLPREVPRDTRGIGYPLVGNVAIDHDVSELRIGNEHAVVDQRRPHAGADGHRHHEPAVPA